MPRKSRRFSGECYFRPVGCTIRGRCGRETGIGTVCGRKLHGGVWAESSRIPEHWVYGHHAVAIGDAAFFAETARDCPAGIYLSTQQCVVAAGKKLDFPGRATVPNRQRYARAVLLLPGLPAPGAVLDGGLFGRRRVRLDDRAVQIAGNGMPVQRGRQFPEKPGGAVSGTPAAVLHPAGIGSRRIAGVCAALRHGIDRPNPSECAGGMA